ncbi:hypothetical protein [Micromonospora sp. NPDC047730]|uniref:hypothetical protein n=1 Tax=Micromonospora sp. NPDC047730 TaxID=3364253 RepID=UPI00372280E2
MSETEALEEAGGIDLQHRPTELPKARIAEQQPDTAYALSALGHDAHQALSHLSAGPTTGPVPSPATRQLPAKGCRLD